MTVDKFDPYKQALEDQGEGSSSRRAAIETLTALEEGVPLKKSLRKYRKTLSPADQGLCLEIVEGVLRRRPLLDHLLTPFLRRPLASLDRGVRTALQTGLYQLLFLDRVPTYAAVDSTVAAAKGRGPKSVVNGVLRSVLRAHPEDANRADWVRAALDLAEDPQTKAALLGGLPGWLAHRWSTRVPVEIQEDCWRALSERPRLTMRAADPGKADQLLQELQALDLSAAPHPLLPGSLLVDSTGVFQSAPFTRGDLFVQDASSTLAVLLAAAGNPARVLDICTAPGGKLMTLAGLLPEAELLGTDLSEQRLEKTRENLERLGIHEKVRLVQGEGVKAVKEEKFDLVFLDAPCSAWGTLRKNPESRWLSREADPQNLAPAQMELLAAAAGKVAEGGVLAYFVCSMEPEETTSVAGTFKTAGFTLFRPNLEPAWQEALLPDEPGWIIWPSLQRETAGGYLCLWRRESGS